MSAALHGLMAEFLDHEQLLAAARRAHAAGYRKMDAYAPFPIEGLADELGRQRPWIPFLVLIGGILGGAGGYLMQWFSMAVDYPLNIGGRPLHSWPAFIPITFELTVLGAAVFALVGMLALNRLPLPHHPVFNAAGFARASIDRFFLCIEAADPKFELAATRQFLETLDPVTVTEVENK